jgi:hypothetical protein
LKGKHNRPLWVAVQGPVTARPLYIHTYIHRDNFTLPYPVQISLKKVRRPRLISVPSFRVKFVFDHVLQYVL